MAWGCQAGGGSPNLTTMKTHTQVNPTELHTAIKLGIDAHAKWFYVARQLDGATPQPVQKMTFDGLLRFVAKQQRLAREVFTCYEEQTEGQVIYKHEHGWQAPEFEFGEGSTLNPEAADPFPPDDVPVFRWD